jgi:hypothetical protein
MRGVPERVARSSAPLTSFQAHETPSFARFDLLESLSSERRSIDVAGVGALAIATIARCTAFARLATSSGLVSDISCGGWKIKRTGKKASSG